MLMIVVVQTDKDLRNRQREHSDVVVLFFFSKSSCCVVLYACVRACISNQLTRLGTAMNVLGHTDRQTDRVCKDL